METKGFIFDYGGTIDNNGDHWAPVIREAFATLPVPEIPLDRFCQAYVYAERLLARERHILPEHNFAEMMRIKAEIELGELAGDGTIDARDIPEFAAQIAAYCDERARACTARAIPVLEYLSQKYSLALVSNFYGNINSVLEHYGLARFFPHVIESAVVGVRKPDPAIFRLGVDALKLEPEQTVVVGDSISKDIVPAQSIGCNTVWIKGRPWFGESTPQHAGTSIDSLSELVKLY